LGLLLFILSSCQAENGIVDEETNAVIVTKTVETVIPGYTSELTRTLTPTWMPKSTMTITPDLSATELMEQILFTETPIVARPGGTVLEQASCRYGPGSAYLFEWGLYPGDYVRILNNNVDGTWVFVKPRTYNNECWVKKDLLETRGDVASLEVYYSPLPQGYLYKPTHYVLATRNGNEVLVQWEPVWMTEDDDRGYLIEAWVCQNGNYIFLPVGIFPYTMTFARIIDEPGCQKESQAKIYTVEKHGYIMPPVDIIWPQNP
jgi:hypothetical protein